MLSTEPVKQAHWKLTSQFLPYLLGNYMYRTRMTYFVFSYQYRQRVGMGAFGVTSYQLSTYRRKNHVFANASTANASVNSHARAWVIYLMHRLIEGTFALHAPATMVAAPVCILPSVVRGDHPTTFPSTCRGPAASSGTGGTTPAHKFDCSACCVSVFFAKDKRKLSSGPTIA